MTQQDDAVGGATDEPIVAAEPTIEDRFANLFENDGDEEPRDEPTQEEGEEPELTEDDILEEPEIPALKPPISWTDEEKAAFAQLPAELQETVTRRESEREKFIQTKAREAREAQSQAQQSAYAQIEEMQNLYAQQLQALIPQVPQKPSAHLQIQDPHRYAIEMDAHENASAQHEYIVQQMQGIAAQQQQMAEHMRSQREAQDIEALRDTLPEYFEPETAAELRNTLRSTAADLGYSDDAIANVDAGDVLALNKAASWKAKADKYDALMSKRMEKVRGAKQLPRVSRPGTPRGKGEVANERYMRDREAMRAGDRDATNRVFSKFL